MFRAGEFIDERYRVVREIGSGAYGIVYLAEEVDRFTILNAEAETVLRRVAVKVIDRFDLERKRFAAEVRALCRLNHPGIVKVFGYGVTMVDSTVQNDRAGAPWPDDNPTRPYLAMEYVEGLPLSDIPAPQARDSLARYLGTFIHVAEALGHAHARGVIHRDLKPHNILVSQEDVPRVVDFGLSWLAKPDEGASRRLGTPGYMAPELIENDAPDADHRADIYSLGATMYRLFIGRTPFQAQGVMATIKGQLAGEFEFPDEFPAALRSLVARCLHKDPLNRPRSAAIVAEELRHIALAPGLFESSSAGEASTLDGYTELPDRADVRDARISELERFDHPTRGRGLKFAAFTGDSDESGAARGFLYAGKENSAARRVFNVLESAWEGAELSIYNAKPIQDSSGRRFLAVDGTTVPVLEPYFPVSVTNVATAEGVRCGACASRVLVDLRSRRDWGTNLVLGSIAHDMLEELVREEKSLEDFDQLFDDNLAKRRIDAVAAGIEDGDLPKIRTQLRAHFENLRRWTEPTRTAKLAEVKRYSSRYGLEGRIDLALVDEKETQIIELKTGSFESPQHERQLRCYTLLWDAIAQRNGRKVQGRLLYSKTGKLKPLSRRNHESEREVLIARNDIVAMHRYYSDGDTSYRPLAYGDDPQRCADYPCKWRRTECEQQNAILGNFRGKELGLEDIDRSVWGDDIDSKLVHATREYYAHFVRLIEREYRSASRAMGAVFRTATIPARVAKLRAVENASLTESSRESRRVRFACNPWGVFDVGDSVVAHRGDFDAEPALTGRVVGRTRESLEISCNGADFATDLPPDGWVIDKDVLRIGFRAMHKALYRFVSTSSPSRLERVVLPSLKIAAGQRTLGIAPQDVKTIEVKGSGQRELNDEQKAAVSEALRDNDAFLIHGPPGTGKTTVIAELVCGLLAEDKRVLLAACTHTAVNNVLAKVVEAGVTDVLRIGSTSRGSAELDRALSKAKRPVKAHYSDDLARRTHSQEELRGRLLSVRVVAATTNACVSSSVFSILEDGGDEPAFDVAIVDEASQLTEPLALAAVNLAKRFVLVGDDQQLPPVVTADDALSANVERPDGVLQESGIRGLDHSLFARLRPHVPHVMLTTQYRMSESVQEFPNNAFYDGKLSAWPGVRDRVMPAREESTEQSFELDPKRGFVWIETEPADTPRLNDNEVAHVAQTVQALLPLIDHEDAASQIGVVSPFRAQCHAIRSALRELDGGERVEVDTVERFQGREKEVMLVSLVAPEWSDFVMSPERLNVTLTRARSKVIVFGTKSVKHRFFESFGGKVPAE